MDCDCPKKNCPRHGKCTECEAYHLQGKRLPYCKREKGFLKKLLKLG
ncbi:MAG: hypothetical protein Q8920_00015 [Bacillota bacterium]|nr:hypothetical protein [Bacillota bacterium]